MADYSDKIMKNREKLYNLNPFMKLLHITLDEIAEGYAVLSMPLPSRDENGAENEGYANGSLAALADTAMGFAFGSMGMYVVTIEFQINYINTPDAGGALRARAAILSIMDRVGVAEVDIRGITTGSVVAKATGSFFLTPPPK